jgi:hypothetical protein
MIGQQAERNSDDAVSLRKSTGRDERLGDLLAPISSRIL